MKADFVTVAAELLVPMVTDVLNIAQLVGPLATYGTSKAQAWEESKSVSDQLFSLPCSNPLDELQNDV